MAFWTQGYNHHRNSNDEPLVDGNDRAAFLVETSTTFLDLGEFRRLDGNSEA